ncbi:acyltransferase [Pseudoalteromonas xiamenensis]
MKSNLIDYLRFVRKVGLPLYCVNVLVQRVLRLDSKLRFNKHFCSRYIGGGYTLPENCLKVKLSLAASGGCYFHAGNGIEIGSGTIWSANVSVISLDHDLDDYDKAVESGPIKIGKNCWLGTGSTVLSGVVLGDKTVVGANSVVTKSFPEGNVIIAGCPAKVIRKL